jgi:hypothetical protein
MTLVMKLLSHLLKSLSRPHRTMLPQILQFSSLLRITGTSALKPLRAGYYSDDEATVSSTEELDMHKPKDVTTYTAIRRSCSDSRVSVAPLRSIAS